MTALSRTVAGLLCGVLTLAVLATLPTSAAAVPTGISAAESIRSASPPAAARAPRSDFVRLPQQCLTTDDLTPADPIVCNLNEYRKNRPTLVLWGDSHMWMMIPAIKAASRGRAVNLVTFIMGSCPPGDPRLTRRTRRSATPCERTNDRATRFVKKLQRRRQPVQVVLGSFWGRYLQALQDLRRGQRPVSNADSARLFRSDTPKLFRWLGRNGVDVDVDAQGASVPANEPRCGRGTFPWSCRVAQSRALLAHRASTRFLVNNIGKLAGSTRYIDVNRDFCNGSVCRARNGGIYTWWDKLHISASKSATLGRFFAPTINQLARQPRSRPVRRPNRACRIPVIRKPCIPRR